MHRSKYCISNTWNKGTNDAACHDDLDLVKGPACEYLGGDHEFSNIVFESRTSLGKTAL